MNKKFRVYDKVEKRYVTDEKEWLTDESGNLWYYKDDIIKADPNRYIVEYGTGLCDKHGKQEMFSGDIIKDKYGNKYIIVFEECKFKFQNSVQDDFCKKTRGAICDIGIEITGNIHEEE